MLLGLVLNAEFDSKPEHFNDVSTNIKHTSTGDFMTSPLYN